ncbi:MAG: hypothetical protein KAG96_05620 [Ichthyobacteriaceae bacterium]|nr:hypothetical protein [Ichthyobacteriaceae bacterium]
MSKEQKVLSPEKYITTKARNLELEKAYISDNWSSAGIATIIISRKHKDGNITHALFQIDLLAEGIVNTFFEFNLESESYNKLIEHYTKEQNLVECAYDLAHELIWGSFEFAKEFKLKPHVNFDTTQFLLEPISYHADEEFNIEFGDDNMPLVIVSVGNEKKELISQLTKNVGADSFKVINIEDLEAEEDDHHHHDHSHNHIFDLPENSEPDNGKNVENWTEADWQAFENGEMKVTEKITLQVIDFMYNSHFIDEEISDLINIDNLDVKKLKISKEPIKENDFFENTEIKTEVREQFLDMLDKPSNKHIEYFKNAIKLHPNNPQLYSYLTNTYIKLNNITEADETTKSGFIKFPDYLFGQISYAQTLLQEGMSHKVLEVFNNKLDLPTLLPNRKEFHILEVVNYYSIMCLYFTTQNDIASANVYWKLIKELNELEEEIVLLAENELMVLKATILKSQI